MQKVSIWKKPLFHGKPIGLDYETTRPLFQSFTIILLEKCERCSDVNDFSELRYFGVPCSCPSDMQIEYTQRIVSVIGNPVKTLPNESIYNIKIVKGQCLWSELYTACLDIDNLVCDFSIDYSMQSSDEYYRKLACDYLLDMPEPQPFANFAGVKDNSAYYLAFKSLVSKLMMPIVPEVQKENPHISAKKKKK